MASGGSVSATVGFGNPESYDPAFCQPPAVWGIKVYPPDEFVPLYLGFIDEIGCAGPVNQLHTTAVYPS